MRKILFFLLGISFVAFGLDLFHMIFHLADAPSLWQIRGVPVKFMTKLALFLIPVIFYFSRRLWLSWLVVFLFLITVSGPAGWAKGQGGCEDAAALLEQSGVARDAHEDFMGRIKRDPPYTSFPADMDKITWWGAFKPFEFWESPQFQPVWIDPKGREMPGEKFRGTKCRLAKTTVKAQHQPNGQFVPGMWKVRIMCDNYLVDQRDVAILPTGPSGRVSQDPKARPQQTVMIWAQDALNEKDK